MRWPENVACTIEIRNAYTTLIGNPEETRSFERHWHKFEDNIKIYLTAIISFKLEGGCERRVGKDVKRKTYL
jgi:hypothetical protein